MLGTGSKAFGLVLSCVTLTGCGAEVLDPAGREATEVAELTWLMVGLGTAVWVLVVVLLIVGLRRRPSEDEQELRGRRFILLGGVVLPGVVIVVLMVLGGLAMSGAAGDDTVEVQITGHQYWWEVRYPDQGVVTANEVHLPVDRPVRLVLRSEDVIHSFWVPRLGGKMDLIPGTTNVLELEPTEVGVHRGRCAEYCGLQHTRMQFEAVVSSEQDFEQWLADRAGPARPVATDDDERFDPGFGLFLSEGCARCHRIDGTAADGSVGPDLTHVGSRRTLGAGVVKNTPGEMARWIVDPQSVKPGVEMPAFGDRLTPAQLGALVDYLQGLE
jgi:cytochrome c oxidase subunit 2